MDVRAAPAAVEFVRERGGRLYVWKKRTGCCRAIETLATATDPPARLDFACRYAADGFELFLPASLRRLPDELHLELGSFPRRVAAYWDGCAWVV